MVFLPVEGDVAGVLVPAASEQHGQVARGVSRAVSHIAQEENLRGIEQRAAPFGRVRELLQQVIEQLKVCILECRHLLDLTRLLAVVRSVVFADPSAGGGRRCELFGNAVNDHSRRVGLDGEMNQIEPLTIEATRNVAGGLQRGRLVLHDKKLTLRKEDSSSMHPVFRNA